MAPHLRDVLSALKNGACIEARPQPDPEPTLYTLIDGRAAHRLNGRTVTHLKDQGRLECTDAQHDPATGALTVSTWTYKYTVWDE